MHILQFYPHIFIGRFRAAKYTRLRDISETLKDQVVTIRARVHRTTGKGGAAFLVLRESFNTCQAVIFVEVT
jgi:aspartyl/asparaginyl-tRNA synthetase